MQTNKCNSIHSFLVRPSPLDLVCFNTLMASLPRMFVEAKAFGLGLRDTRHYAHFENDLAGVGLGFRTYRTGGDT